MILVFLLVLFCGLVHFVDTSSSAKASYSSKKARRNRSASDQQDHDYILSRLQEKFNDALGSHASKMLCWNQVEICGGWPSSVYHLEPLNWCKHDIKVLKEAIDSIEIRALRGKQEEAPLAYILHAQLMVECKRLKLIKNEKGVIDWRRIAANTDGLRVTTTHFRKWNAQDRRMIQRLIENLKSISDVSAMRQFSPVKKHSEEVILQNLRKGWKIGQKRKAALIEPVKVDSEEHDSENESEEEYDKEYDDETSQDNEDENEDESQTIQDLNSIPSVPPMQQPIVFGLPVDDLPLNFPFFEQDPTILPSFHQDPADLLLSQYLDVLSDSIEDSQLEAIVHGDES